MNVQQYYRIRKHGAKVGDNAEKCTADWKESVQQRKERKIARRKCQHDKQLAADDQEPREHGTNPAGTVANHPQLRTDGPRQRNAVAAATPVQIDDRYGVVVHGSAVSFRVRLSASDGSHGNAYGTANRSTRWTFTWWWNVFHFLPSTHTHTHVVLVVSKSTW